jgi:hypothetical protein
MSTPDDRARIAAEAESAARHEVLRLAESAAAEVREEPLFPGARSMTRRPVPLAGIRMARSLEHAAVRVAASFVRGAREDGIDWRTIGEALGLEPDDGDIATAAWEHAAGPRYRMDPLYFGWTCPACAQRVRDYGPYGGHPADAEQGHAKGCTRMAEAVRAYMAQWEDDDG